MFLCRLVNSQVSLVKQGFEPRGPSFDFSPMYHTTWGRAALLPCSTPPCPTYVALTWLLSRCCAHAGSLAIAHPLSPSPLRPFTSAQWPWSDSLPKSTKYIDVCLNYLKISHFCEAHPAPVLFILSWSRKLRSKLIFKQNCLNENCAGELLIFLLDLCAFSTCPSFLFALAFLSFIPCPLPSFHCLFLWFYCFQELMYTGLGRSFGLAWYKNIFYINTFYRSWAAAIKSKTRILHLLLVSLP